MARPLTGKHVFAIFASSFAIVLGVNLFMAYNAVRTFPGLEAKNSYDASQGFDAKRSAQEALGWATHITHQDDAIRIKVTDKSDKTPALKSITLTVGRPATAQFDQTLTPVQDGDVFTAKLPLEAGNWRVYLEAVSIDDTPYSIVTEIMVKS